MSERFVSLCLLLEDKRRDPLSPPRASLNTLASKSFTGYTTRMLLNLTRRTKAVVRACRTWWKCRLDKHTEHSSEASQHSDPVETTIKKRVDIFWRRKPLKSHVSNHTFRLMSPDVGTMAVHRHMASSGRDAGIDMSPPRLNYIRHDQGPRGAYSCAGADGRVTHDYITMRKSMVPSLVARRSCFHQRFFH